MAKENLKQQTKRGLYWQFLNQFSNYGIQFIIGIFMARLLSPEDYGITALPGVFMAVAGIFAGAGFGTAMVRKPELHTITKTVKEIDPSAFVTVSSASTVYGEGFDEMKTGLKLMRKKKSNNG